MSRASPEPTTVASAVPERIIVLAPYLRGMAGHHLALCGGIADAARRRGLDVDIVVERGQLAPELLAALGARDLLPPSPIPWELPTDAQRPDYAFSLRHGERFAAQAEALDILIDDRPTLIVVDGLQPARFFGLGAWLQARHADKPVAALHMAFTFNLLDRRSGAEASVAQVYAALLSAIDAPRADIAVFGRRYRDGFEALTGSRTSLYPLPIDVAAMPRATPDAERPLTIVVHVPTPGAVEAAIDCANDRFVRRHFAPRLKVGGWGALSPRQRELLAAPGVPIITPRLQRADYIDLFRTEGVMLFAYGAVAYRCSSSGIMTEAAASGLVTVVPGQTWLSDCIDDELAAGIAFEALTGSDLVRALKTVHRDWRALSALAGRRAPRMRQVHSADAFIDRAMASFPSILGDARIFGHPVGVPLTFQHHEGIHHLTSGWSFAEPWGRWTEGEIAQVRLYALGPDDSGRRVVPRRLRIEAMGLSPRDRRQVVDVRSGAVAVGRCVFESGDGPMTFDLPLPLEAQNPDLRLTFDIRHPVRPLDIGLGNDPRRLGFGLISLRVSDGD